MLMTPACPQPVSTTSPRPATLAISAWSSRISGSGFQLPPRQAWWMACPFSNPVVRSTSPVTSTDRLSRKAGVRCSMMLKASLFQRASAGRGHFERLSAGNGQPPPGPELRVDQHWHVRAAELADEAG